MKKFALGAAALFAVAGTAVAQDTLAYWHFNNQGLPGGGFGFQVGEFPKGAENGLQVGTANLTVGGGDSLANNGSTYTWLQSFAGTTVNAQFGEPAGGSIALQNGNLGANNGAYFEFAFDATNYQDIVFSFAGQRTATGFTSILIEAYDGASLIGEIGTVNDLLGTFAATGLRSLSTNLLDDVADARIRLTFSGGSTASTASAGNNRLDNIVIQGTVIPAPGAIALAGIAGLVGLRRRRA